MSNVDDENPDFTEDENADFAQNDAEDDAAEGEEFEDLLGGETEATDGEDAPAAESEEDYAEEEEGDYAEEEEGEDAEEEGEYEEGEYEEEEEGEYAEDEEGEFEEEEEGESLITEAQIQPEEAEGLIEEEEEEEEDLDEEALAKKRKKLLLILELVSLAFISGAIIAGTYYGIKELYAYKSLGLPKPDYFFWAMLNVYILALVFIAYTVWKTRGTGTPFRVLLAFSLAAILSAVFSMLMELKRYDYDINAEGAKQRAQIRPVTQFEPPDTMLV